VESARLGVYFKDFKCFPDKTGNTLFRSGDSRKLIGHLKNKDLNIMSFEGLKN